MVGDLALGDIKPDSGWFTWSNNRRGHGLVKERLDPFFVSTSWLGSTPFLASRVVRQANFNHDMVLLDTLGRASKAGKDSRLLFQYEACWLSEGEAKRVVEEAWMQGHGDVLRGDKRVQNSLGKW